MNKSAVLSACEKYRYRLGRTWDAAGRLVAFIMLNPSTADADLDDPTIRRCIGFARAWGYGGLVVGNLFALRATDPKALKTTPAPIGPDNDTHLRAIASECAEVVCAWGRHGTLYGRDRSVLRLLTDSGAPLHRLSKPGAEYPMHPLYLPADLRPTAMEVRP